MRASICWMSEIARSTSPRGHDAAAKLNIALDAGVMPEPKGQIIVTAGLEQGERPFPR